MRIYTNCRIAELYPPRVAELDVAVEGGSIAAVAEGLAARGDGAEVVDLEGGLLMPGFVCAHTHLYSALARGITARIPPISDFVTRLQGLWWRLDRAIDAEILRFSALAGALDALSSGTTAVVDHHASPNCIDGSLDIIREALEEVGLRGVLCYETTDRNGAPGALAGVRENTRFATAARGGLVGAAIGAHAPFTLSDETLEGLGDAVRSTGCGLHIHVAEDAYDVGYSHGVHGKDLIRRLDDCALLGERSIVAHGVHLRLDELEVLTERDAFLVHNARSNMNNHVGYNASIYRVPNVAMGTDGISGDMPEETRAAYYRARDAGLDPAPDEIARRLSNGNEILRRAFGRPFGSIAPGSAADLVVLDYDPPTPLEAGNLASHLLFGISSRHLRSVVVGGRQVWGEGAGVDAERISAIAREQALRLWRRMDELE